MSRASQVDLKLSVLQDQNGISDMQFGFSKSASRSVRSLPGARMAGTETTLHEQNAFWLGPVMPLRDDRYGLTLLLSQYRVLTECGAYIYLLSPQTKQLHYEFLVSFASLVCECA